MARFFSPTTGGFYSEDIHGPRTILKGKRPVANPDCAIPPDAVAVSEDDYHALFDAQAEGKTIVAQDGQPVAVDPEPDLEAVVAANRMRRNRLLKNSDWSQLADVPLDEAQAAAWREYRQQLRDLDLAAPEWPAAPDQEEE